MPKLYILHFRANDFILDKSEREAKKTVQHEKKSIDGF